MESRLSISEIFGCTIQGEGALIGKPTVFVRTGGCDSRCSWCDTLYAVLPEHKDEWHTMNSHEVLAEVERLAGHKPILVTLSGGNPAIQPLGELIDLGHQQGYTFAIETQGTVARSWFARLDYLTLSPKPPSSKQEMKWDKLQRCIEVAQAEEKGPQICLKIVIFDDVDFAYAQSVASKYPEIPMYLQAGNHTPPQVSEYIDIEGIIARLDWLITRVQEEKWYNVTVLPQLHTLLWGNKRGV